MPVFESLYKLFVFLARHTRHIRHANLLGAGVVVAAVLSGVANIVLIMLMNRAINAEGPERDLLLPLFLGTCVVFPLIRYTGDYLLIYLTEMATVHVRMMLSTRVLAVPLRKLEELGAARVNAILINDLGAVVGAMTLIPLLSLNITIVLGCLAFMGFLSWQMLIGVLVFLVMGVVAYNIPLRRGYSHIRALREQGDELFRHLRSLTEGIKELKLHHERRRAFLNQELRATSVGALAHSAAAQRGFSAAVSWGQVLIFLLIGGVVFALPHFTVVNKPVLTGFTFAILYMVGPVQVVLNSMTPLSRAMVAMERVEEIGLLLAQAARPEVVCIGDGEQMEWNSLELDGVTHTYFSERDGSTFTLGPVDLAFRPGEIVFLTGGNGSGKTTLAKLLTGLYTPESGEVRLDGEPVDGAVLDRYHTLFSVVFSDFYLFDSLLGLEREALDADARHYLEELQLDHKVRVEGGKISTTNLSQGQRKRLALLTAYMENRPIYLFDEWAADQDPHFKSVFYNQLLPRLRDRGKTVFVISHDDGFYHLADRLIRLESGQVVHDSREGGGAPLEVALARTEARAVAHGEAL